MNILNFSQFENTSEEQKKDEKDVAIISESIETKDKTIIKQNENVKSFDDFFKLNEDGEGGGGAPAPGGAPPPGGMMKPM